MAIESRCIGPLTTAKFNGYVKEARDLGAIVPSLILRNSFICTTEEELYIFHCALLSRPSIIISGLDFLEVALYRLVALQKYFFDERVI